MSVHGFSDNKCRVPVVKQSEFEDFKEELNGKFSTSQEDNNDFLVKKMCLLHYGTTQPVVREKYKDNTSITTGEYIETRFVTDFYQMFGGCSKLTTVLEYDTKNATDMSGMFYKCSSLTNIPKLNTSNVTNMYGIFNLCSSLTNIPKLDTSNVENMGYMFSECTSLTSIPEIDTNKVTDMSKMFYNCPKLTTIPKLDTSNVTNMKELFYGCTNLTSIPDLDTSNIKHLTYVENLVYGCTSLTTLKDNPLAPEGSRWQFKVNVDFSPCPLNRTSILKVFNGLQTVTGKTIKISSTTNGYLSTEDKAIATAKGWTVTVV